MLNIIKKVIVKENLNVDVSFFIGMEYYKNVQFGKIIEIIKTGFYNEKINLIREGKVKNNNIWKELKKQLPAFTPCATFNTIRQSQHIQDYNKIVPLDLDKIFVNIEESSPLVELVNNNRYTYASFISPSGNGLKIFVKIDSQIEFHEDAFKQVAEYYQNLLGIEVDKTGKDITRLCYISSDERAYLNEKSEVFNITGHTEEAAASTQCAKVVVPIVGKTQFEKLVDLTLRVQQFTEGNRNNFINLLANNCNRWGLSQSEAIANILHSEYCYERKEVIPTILSAYKNSHQHNTYPVQGIIQKGMSNNDACVAAVAQQRNATLERFRSFKQLAEEGKHLKPLKKLFGNFILEKSTTLFPSERGVGKSFLAMQIAIKIAEGAKEYLGEEIEIQGNVLYVNLELGDHTIKKRMEKLLMDNESNSEFSAYSFDERSGFFESIELIREFCQAKKPVLIIIDNLRTAFVGADNEKNKVMTSVISEINKLKDEFNCSFLIVHHTKKGTGNQLTNSDMQSGAGSLSDLVDADFFLRKSGIDKNYRILKRIKARECEEQEGAKLISLNSDSLWFELIDEEIDESIHVLDEKSIPFKEKREEKIIQLIKQGMSDSDIARELNVNRSTPFRIRQKISKV